MNPIVAQSSIASVGAVPGTYPSIGPRAGSQQTVPTAGTGFGDVVQGYLQQVNGQQLAVDAAISDFVTGKTDNIQHVVLAMAQADLSFQFFMEVRNKVIESFHELMRMQF